jgi:hypothetical protein
MIQSQLLLSSLPLKTTPPIGKMMENNLVDLEIVLIFAPLELKTI